MPFVLIFVSGLLGGVLTILFIISRQMDRIIKLMENG